MGKRKSSSKPMAKKGPGKIGATFDCVYCATDKAVSMTFSKPSNRWHVLCRACDASWDMDCSPGQKLEPIDVYYEWIDAAEEVRREEEKARAAQTARRPPPQKKTTTPARRSRSASPDRNRNRRERSDSEEDDEPRGGARASGIHADYDDEDAEGEDDNGY